MDNFLAAAGCITTVAAAAAIVLKVYGKFHAVIEGIRCQLRSDMLQVYYRHKDTQTIRQYEKENFEHNYNAYVALGGNSFIGDIHDQVSTWEITT